MAHHYHYYNDDNAITSADLLRMGINHFLYLFQDFSDTFNKSVNGLVTMVESSVQNLTNNTVKGFQLSSANYGPPAGRCPNRWGGFRILLNRDSSSTLVALDNEVLSKTVGNIHGTGFFGLADPTSLVRPPIGEWDVTEVLTCGINLWDREFSDPVSTFGKEMQVTGDNGGVNSFIHFLVGYSPYTLEYVFAGPPETNTDVDHPEQDDNFSILQYRKNPGESIIHHALAVPGNMWCLESALIQKNSRLVFEGGGIDGTSAKALTVASYQSLDIAHTTPVVVARISPPPASRKELLPKVDSYLLRNSELQCFVYKVPYLSNLVYPSELYEKLTNFARAYPDDKFNATSMLFATQLWTDLVEHPTKMVEAFMAGVRNPPELPHIPVGIFVAYFEAWLKVNEHLQCIQYDHPLRVISRMYQRDIQADDLTFQVKRHILDDEEIRALTLRAGSRCPPLPVATRVAYLPFLMNGTTMAQPQDLNDHAPFSPTEQAMIGMPRISVLGLLSLHSQQGHKPIIAVPEAIDRLSFYGL
ncbi:hypothetical protein B0J13DRAFT_678584 [Dactylonectria estremocensis]|uniref:Uncharacterized protein n=1 Tax=Dactylonectria estremocensis TaxID=1079267 RepID=A0A9P9IQK5_9HYPO|nr:hypothetical protein B0J13DRAFT_678584 [Dactylonectria estremocensis]